MEEILMGTNQITPNDIKFDEKYGPLINGEIVEAAGGYIYAVNASTGEVLAQIGRGGEADVDKAVKAARAAYPDWANTLIEARSAMLNKVADVLEENAERLKMIESMDTGRAIHEFDLDYQLAIYQFRYFAGAVLTHYDGESRP